VRQPDDLESTGEAFGEPLVHRQRRRPEEDDFERDVLRRVLIPEALGTLRPPGNLLNFVDDQNRAIRPGPERQMTTCFPVLRNPVALLQCGFVGGNKVNWAVQPGHDLAHQGGFTDLAWPQDGL